MAKKNTRKVARGSKTEKFVKVSDAKKHPATTEVQTVRTGGGGAKSGIGHRNALRDPAPKGRGGPHGGDDRP